MKNPVIHHLAIAATAVFAGGSLTVLFILVPFWQSLSPDAVMDWFHQFGSDVGMLMMPMEIIALVICIGAYIMARKTDHPGKNRWLWATVSNVVILGMFFVYFMPVTLRLVNKTMEPMSIPAELENWKMMHVIRTVFTLISVGFAIAATRKKQAPAL